MQAPSIFSEEMTVNPYPAYQAMRDQTPVHSASFGPGQGLRGAWILMRHDDVYGALRDHETFASGFPAGGGPGGVSMVLINDDPPRHTRFRKLVNKAFTPRRIAELEPWITGVADELLAEVGPGETDVVSNYTIPLPVKVIARLLGIPGEEYRTFKSWTDSVLNFDSGGPDRMQKVFEMVTYFGKMAAARREHGAEDLITALVEAEVEGEALQDSEVLGFCILLLIAGNETTTNLMGNMLNVLAERPALWAQLRDDRSLVPIVIEETLRFESPVQFLFRRTTRDTEVSGVTIPEGQSVLPFVGAANRDPSEFPDPDEFRLDRDLHNHVAFGMGIHYCLGSPLARAEARITLNAFLDRFDRLEPGSTPGLRQTGSPIIYGFRELPLTLGA